MKRSLILCACMLFAVLIMRGNSFIAKGEEEMSDYRFLEIHYSALMQYKICMLIENPADASFLEDEYISSALLAISLETGEYVPSATEHKYYKLNYPDKEYNVDNFEILADEEKILSFLKENGIDGVKKYYVLILPTVIDGFLLYVQTDTDFCFVPFLWYGEQFGKFSDRRIYSLEEFQNLSAPQEAELKAFGKTIDSDVKPVMYAGSVMYPLRAILESANIEVIWNEKEKSIVFGDYKLIVHKSIKKDADLVNIKTGEIESFGYFEITNGRTLVDAYIISAITLRFGFRVTPDWNTYTVHVTDFDVLPVKQTDEIEKTAKELDLYLYENGLTRCDLFVPFTVKGGFCYYEGTDFKVSENLIFANTYESDLYFCPEEIANRLYERLRQLNS